MTQTPQDTPHAWLAPDRVLRWLQVSAGTPQAELAEDCRMAAGAWVEEQRRDLAGVDVDGLPTFGPVSESIVMAGLLAAARLYARRSSPAGLASFAELGAAEVLRADPDVARHLGVGRHARPQVG